MLLVKARAMLCPQDAEVAVKNSMHNVLTK